MVICCLFSIKYNVCVERESALRQSRKVKYATYVDSVFPLLGFIFSLSYGVLNIIFPPDFTNSRRNGILNKK